MKVYYYYDHETLAIANMVVPDYVTEDIYLEIDHKKKLCRTPELALALVVSGWESHIKAREAIVQSKHKDIEKIQQSITNMEVMIQRAKDKLELVKKTPLPVQDES